MSIRSLSARSYVQWELFELDYGLAVECMELKPLSFGPQAKQQPDSSAS